MIGSTAVVGSAGIRTGLLVAACAALLGPASAAAESADPERGQALYALCAQCHGALGEGNPAALAPAIAGLPRWYVEAQLRKFRGGMRGYHPQDVGGLRMKPMSRWLTGDDDIRDVAAVVAALPAQKLAPLLDGGDPERGRTLYAPCTACHGLQGEGNEPLGSPALTHASDWYLLTQLANFKAGVRGTHPQDTTGAIMRPMSMVLADEQAMKDVIAYIRTLAK